MTRFLTSEDASVNGTRRALDKWLSLPAKEKLATAYRILRGCWFYRHFAAARYPQIGRRVWIRHEFGEIVLGAFCKVSDEAALSVFGRDAAHPARLTIGDYSSIGPRTHINCGMSITIGQRCAISWDCEILDTDIHTLVLDDGSRSCPAPVVIGDRVWVGTRSIILKGVTIGDGVVIGAGSVITHDIPPHCLAVGNPARPVRSIQGWLPYKRTD